MHGKNNINKTYDISSQNSVKSWQFRLPNSTRFVTDISVHSPGFKSRSAYVEVLVDKAALKWGIFECLYLNFPLSTLFHHHTLFIHPTSTIDTLNKTFPSSLLASYMCPSVRLFHSEQISIF